MILSEVSAAAGPQTRNAAIDMMTAEKLFKHMGSPLLII
jgi:hypothetical protein